MGKKERRDGHEAETMSPGFPLLQVAPSLLPAAFSRSCRAEPSGSPVALESSNTCGFSPLQFPQPCTRPRWVSRRMCHILRAENASLLQGSPSRGDLFRLCPRFGPEKTDSQSGDYGAGGPKKSPLDGASPPSLPSGFSFGRMAFGENRPCFSLRFRTHLE